MTKRRGAAFILMLTMCGVTGTLARAQEAGRGEPVGFLQQQRQAERQLNEQGQRIAPIESLLDWQWGGWLSYNIFSFNDGVQSSRILQRPELAVWTRLGIDHGAHEIFGRMKLNYAYFDHGDEYDRQQDWIGPNFDRVFYRVDVGRALHLSQAGDPSRLLVSVGRQSVVFGTGYVLDMPLDAVLIDARVRDLRIRGLAGKAIPSYPNIDRSEAVDSHSRRCLFGVEAEYEGWNDHVPFAYAIWNNDRTDERPEDKFQDYSYDSFYAGLGAHGALAHNLNYWAEGVFETGQDFGDGAIIRRDDINAYGWDVGIEKLFDVPTRPRVVGEYMFASGDADRLLSTSGAAGGNRTGSLDAAFNGFGFRDTGVSAALIPSNLHIWRAGASFAPLEKLALFRDFELGSNWFLYHKNHAHGAISDATADEPDGFVGWEMDYYVNWRLSSDLSWTIRWGTFFPGDAYSDQGSRCFLFSGLTWSF